MYLMLFYAVYICYAVSRVITVVKAVITVKGYTYMICNMITSEYTGFVQTKGHRFQDYLAMYIHANFPLS